MHVILSSSGSDNYKASTNDLRIGRLNKKKMYNTDVPNEDAKSSSRTVAR